MTSQKPDAERITDGTGDLSLIAVVNMVLRQIRLFLVLPIVFAILGAGLALQRTPEYMASTAFVANNSPQPNRMGLLAAQLGFSMPSGEGGQTPDFYRALISTRDILGGVVDHTYEFAAEDGEVISGTIADLYELEDTGRRTRRELAMLTLRSISTVGVDDLTGIVTLTVSTPWKPLSEQIASRTLAEVVRFDMEKRQTRGGAERRFAEARLDSARAELRQAEDRLEAFVQRNRQYATSPALALDYSRLQRDLFMRQEVYTALFQSFERARIEEVRNTPVITIIESPEGSAVRGSRGGVTSVLMGLFFGFFVALFVGAMREFGRHARRSDREDYREFVRLRDQAVRGLVPWRHRRKPIASLAGAAALSGNGREDE
jgi:uncharacterized protein involved in exopolysaccharide biosynthesis